MANARVKSTRLKSSLWLALGAALLIAAAGLCAVGQGVGLRIDYLGTITLLVLWFAVVGRAFNGRFEGLLIDGRNCISLSRLQMFVWLLVVGSAFAVEVAFNFHIGKGPNGDPMAVGVPWQLGLVMGTATTSFLAAPAVLNLKTRNPPTRAQLDLARISAPDGSPPRSNSGRQFSRLHSNQARWADLFRGEELTNAGAADPAKVQQFLATFMLALIYIAGMLRVLPANESKSLEFTDLPAISSGFLVLLGVSHAAYLGAKAVPQSPSSPSLAPDTAIPRVHTIAG